VVHILPQSYGKYLTGEVVRGFGAVLLMTRYYLSLRDGDIFIEDGVGLSCWT
jgi:hypothetical protein